MATGGKMKLTPATTGSTGHGNNNEQAHIISNVTNRDITKTQTHNKSGTTEKETNTTNETVSNGRANNNDNKDTKDNNAQQEPTTGTNIDNTIHRGSEPHGTKDSITEGTVDNGNADKGRANNNKNNDTTDNNNQKPTTTITGTHNEDEWETVQRRPDKKETQMNRTQEKSHKPTGTLTTTTKIQEFTLNKVVDAIDKEKYTVPEFRSTLQISLVEGNRREFNRTHNYLETFKEFYTLLKQQDPTVMILAWDVSLNKNPITSMDDIPDFNTFEKYYTFNRRPSDKYHRMDMTILIASAIQMHEALKRDAPMRQLQKKKWYVHLTKRRYVGASVTIGWLLEIHPTLTNTFTLQEEIVSKLQGITQHLSLGQKTERWKYNDEHGKQQTTQVRVLTVQAPSEMGQQTQKDLFDQWKQYKEQHPQSNESTMSGGMFIPYDIELYDMIKLLQKQEEFLGNYQYPVQIYKCRTLNKPFVIPDALAGLLGTEIGQETTLQNLILSMTVTDTSEKLVRSIEKADWNRYQIIVHQNNIETCRNHMQSAFEILKNNLDDWKNITETEDGASLAPAGYIAALVVSPGKLKQKRDFLSDLIKGNKRSAITKEEFGKYNDNQNVWFGGRGRGRGRGKRPQRTNPNNNNSNLILSNKQANNKGAGYSIAGPSNTQIATQDTTGASYINQLMTNSTSTEANTAITKIPNQLEQLLQKYVKDAVETTMRNKSTEMTQFTESVTQQINDNKNKMDQVQVAIDEHFEYNDTAHKLIQTQIDTLGQTLVNKDAKNNEDLKMILNHIDHRARRADVTSFQLFNEMLKRMEKKDFTPIDEDLDLDTKDITEVLEHEPDEVEPLATPTKPYVTPVNETSQTPINLASSGDSEEQQDQQYPVNETTDNTLITQEEQEAMEAVMNQSTEEANATIAIPTTKDKPQIRATIRAQVNNSSVKLTRLQSKTKQKQHTSREYQTRTRSRNGSKGSGLGKEE
jgi:hypothetical protein